MCKQCVRCKQVGIVQNENKNMQEINKYIKDTLVSRYTILRSNVFNSKTEMYFML